MEGDLYRAAIVPPMFRISIHALRVEGDAKNGALFYLHSISIHALRVEGDAGPGQRHTARAISIHALRVEGDG